MANKRSAKSIPQSTKPLEPLSKNRSWHDYMSDNSFRLFPSNLEWRQRLIFTMYEWVQGNVVEIMEFCMEYKIAYTTLREYVLKYDDVRECYNDIKLMLASRRRIGCLKKQYDKEVVFKDLHRYDPEWKEVDQYHNDLKKEVATSTMADAKLIADNWKKIMDGESEK